MTNRKAFITAGQLFAMLFVSRMVIMITLNPTLTGGESLQDNILSCALALVLNFILIIPIYFLTKKDPEKSLLDCSLDCFGKAGKIVPILYVLHFICIDSYYLSFFHLFLSNVMQPDTPYLLVAVAVLGAAWYASCCGIEGIARAGGFVMVIITAGILFVIISLFPKIEFVNFEPMVFNGPKQMITGTLLFLAQSTGFATMALILPQVKGNRKKGFIIWNVAIYSFMAFLIFVMVGSLGSFVKSQLFPVYTMSELAEAGPFSRLDAVFIGVWITGLFIKLSLDAYLIRLCFSKTSKPKGVSIGTFVSILAIGVLSYFIITSELVQSFFFGLNFLLPLTLFTACLIPLVVLIVSSMKKRRKQN